MIMSVDAKKAFDKTQGPILINHSKLAIEGNLLNLINSIYEELMVTLYLLLKD